MEFRVHTDESGFLRGSNIEWHGPREPGTLLTWRGAAMGVRGRTGFVVAVLPDRVNVAWNDWVIDHRDFSMQEIKEFNQRRQALRAQAKQKKREKWEAKKRERFGDASPSSAATST